MTQTYGPMDLLFKSHDELIAATKLTVRRELFNEIDWSKQVIGIKGTRGAGKTSFMVQIIQDRCQDDRSCLYVNMNYFYFANHTLLSLADEFSKTGGKILFLDQLNKYPNWEAELLACMDNYADLQIVFACSSVLKLDEQMFQDRGMVYNLEGLSFREYLKEQTGICFRKFSLDEIIHDHREIVKEVLSECKPLAYFGSYLHHGYYPFFTENITSYDHSLLKVSNLVLEIDVTSLNQIDIGYVYKLRKLLYILAQNAPARPNVSKLSEEVEVSRATIMNYFQYLKDAKLIKLLNQDGNDNRKPDRVYMNNPNLQITVAPENADPQLLKETFFLNQVNNLYKVQSAANGQFLVDGQYLFTVEDKQGSGRTYSENEYAAADMIEVGEDKRIPLWLFGFLY